MFAGAEGLGLMALVRKRVSSMGSTAGLPPKQMKDEADDDRAASWAEQSPGQNREKKRRTNLGIRQISSVVEGQLVDFTSKQCSPLLVEPVVAKEVHSPSAIAIKSTRSANRLFN